MSTLMESFHPLSMILQEVQKSDEDSIDRLSHKLSTLIFCVLALCATVTQFTGEVIKCWAPAQFNDFWVEYVNSYCWIANTYHVSMSHTNILEAPRKWVVYYQWVPIALFVQAIGFYLPCIVWSFFKRGLGVNVKKVVAVLTRPESINPQTRDEANKFLAKNFDRSLRYVRAPPPPPGASKGNLSCLDGGGGRRLRHSVSCGSGSAVFGYLLTKLLYIGNAAGQLYAMNFFLGTDYTLYGIDVLRDLAANGTYHESPRFPRVTLCDFEVRSLGKNIPYTVQCTLPVNLFNEKMYVFVWFWLVAVTLASVAGLVYAVSELFLSSRLSFVSKYLRSAVAGEKEGGGGGGGGGDGDRLLMREFCTDYLRHDGHFALRLIAKNASDVAIGELIAVMWSLFKAQREKKRKAKEQMV